MTHHYYPMTPMHPLQGCEQPQPMQPWHDNRVLWNAAATGAIVGATGAAALSLHRRRDQGIPWQQVLTDTARAGLTAGVATAAATAVGRMLVRHPAWSLAATVATGTAVMYVLTDQKKEAASE